jgi:hypothetical protein
VIVYRQADTDRQAEKESERQKGRKAKKEKNNE